MYRSLRKLLPGLLAALTIVGASLSPLPALAGGTLTNCTAAALILAMEDAGLVVFNCSGTIPLEETFVITDDTILRTATASNTVRLQMSTNNSARFFDVEEGATLVLENLTLADAFSTNGGAIYNLGTVIATNCLFTNNVAVGLDGTAGRDRTGGGENGGNGTAGKAAAGGAVYNLGTFRAFRSIFRFNNVTGGQGGSGGAGGDDASEGGNGGNGGAGGSALGGAIHNSGTLQLVDCSFIDNSSAGGHGGAGGAAGAGQFPGYNGQGAAGGEGSGAGVYNLGSASVANCTFHINAAEGGSAQAGGTDSGSTNGRDGPNGQDARGGGFCNLGSAFFLNCTFVDNQAVGGNGGNGGPSTFLGGDGGDGGAGRGGSFYNSNLAGFTNCTFTGGRVFGGTNGAGGTAPFAGSAGSIGGAAGGNLNRQAGSVHLLNTILGASGGGKNASGSVVDNGYNISSDNTPGFSHSTSRNSLNPRLGTISSTGGPTQTVPLLGGSPAVDAALGFCPPFDQRGIARPLGTACDIGALESSGKPVITTQPQNITVTNGGIATFTLLVSGEALTYQWRFNGTNVTNSNFPSFTVFAARSTNAGNYSAIVSNAFGSVTSTVAILTVLIPPVITAQPVSTIVTQGQIATLNTTVEGDTPFNFQWQFNSNNIPGEVSQSFSVLSAQPSHTGNYRLIVGNSSGSVTSQTAVITVISPPMFVTQPASMKVFAGDEVTLFGEVTGDAPLRFQWRFNGTNLIGETNSDLIIEIADGTHRGAYTLVASNSFGTATSDVATLDITTSVLTTAFSHANGVFSVTIETIADVGYYLVYTDNLEAPVWVTLPRQNGVDGPLTLTDPNATNVMRFYRIQVE